MPLETITRPKCDVHGTYKDVRRARVVVMAEKGPAGSEEWDTMLDQTVYLSPKAAARMLARIVVNMHPPGWNPEPPEEEKDALDAGVPT